MLGGSFGERGREGLLAALQEATSDEDISVAAEAALALGPVRDLRAATSLIGVLDRAEEAGHASAARRAQEALQALFDDPTARGARTWRSYWSQHPEYR